MKLSNDCTTGGLACKEAERELFIKKKKPTRGVGFGAGWPQKGIACGL